MEEGHLPLYLITDNVNGFKCFSTVGWVAGRASDLQKLRWWLGYLDKVKYKWFACGPADAISTLLSVVSLKSRIAYLSSAGLPR